MGWMTTIVMLVVCLWEGRILRNRRDDVIPLSATH
jgi:hypothetical protein